MFYRCSTARAAATATATTISSKLLFYLLVLYNYLIYNYYYTQTHKYRYTRAERAGAWQRNAAAQWVHSGLCCHTVFTFVSLATVHVIQLDSLWLTLSHAPPALLHCLPLPLSFFLLRSPLSLLPLPSSLYHPLSLTLYLPNNCMRFDGLK